MEIRLCRAGMRIATLWLFLLAGLLGGFLFWLYRPLGVLFWILGVLFCLYFLFLYCPRVIVCFDKEELTVHAGFLFPTLKRIPLRCLCGLNWLSSPLSRAFGCCTIIFYASSGLFSFLPGLCLKDAETLVCLLREG